MNDSENLTVCPICGEVFDLSVDWTDHGPVCVEARLSLAEALRLQQGLAEAPDFILGL